MHHDLGSLLYSNKSVSQVRVREGNRCQAQEVTEGYLIKVQVGLEKLARNGGGISRLATVGTDTTPRSEGAEGEGS